MNRQAAHCMATAEDRWLEKLEAACHHIFSTAFLPSHDHRHHRRVWHYARMILGELQDLGVPLDEDFVEGSLHTAWFHDAGMALDPGPVHGALGAELYLDFLNRSGEQEPVLKAEILEAIRMHDDKERLEETVFMGGERPDLLQVLSVADDLDALGLCGIYRYAEIYLMRGTPLDDLGQSILDNAALRYRNLLHSCRHMPRVRQKIKSGYAEIRSFYTEYKGQAAQGLKEAEKTGGALQKIMYIRKMSMEARMDPMDFVHLLAGEGAHEALLTWFKELTHALENPDL